MKCPLCDLENPPTALWCDCGYNFAPKQVQVFCTTCGRVLNDWDFYCGRCGAQQSGHAHKGVAEGRRGGHGSVECPQCGLENFPTATRCECGHSLTRAESQAFALHCTKCGAQNDPSFKFCHQCATSLAPSTPEGLSRTSTVKDSTGGAAPHRSRTRTPLSQEMKVGLTVFGLCALLVLSGLLLGPGQTERWLGPIVVVGFGGMLALGILASLFSSDFWSDLRSIFRGILDPKNPLLVTLLLIAGLVILPLGIAVFFLVAFAKWALSVIGS